MWFSRSPGCCRGTGFQPEFRRGPASGKVQEVCSGRNLSPEVGLLGAGASGRACPFDEAPDSVRIPAGECLNVLPTMKAMTINGPHCSDGNG